MFIPGLGALIRMQQQVVNPKEDAAIGLAGPIYGLGAALVALGLWRATELPVFAAIAGVGAWINLFNLMPLGSLDGGRGFHAMSRAQRLLAALAVGAAWWLTGDGVLLLVGIVGLARVLGDKAETKGSGKTTVLYILLVASLTAISLTRTQIEIGDEAAALAPPRTAFFQNWEMSKSVGVASCLLDAHRAAQKTRSGQNWRTRFPPLS